MKYEKVGDSKRRYYLSVEEIPGALFISIVTVATSYEVELLQLTTSCDHDYPVRLIPPEDMTHQVRLSPAGVRQTPFHTRCLWLDCAVSDLEGPPL